MAAESGVWLLQRINSKKKTVYQLAENVPTRIGRQQNFDVVVDSVYCSKNQCNITLTNNRIFLEDTSSNGTFINDIPVRKCKRELRHMDVIGLGCNMLTFDAEDPENFYMFQLKNTSIAPVLGTVVDLTAMDGNEISIKSESIDSQQIPMDLDLDCVKQSPKEETASDNGSTSTSCSIAYNDDARTTITPPVKNETDDNPFEATPDFDFPPPKYSDHLSPSPESVELNDIITINDDDDFEMQYSQQAALDMKHDSLISNFNEENCAEHMFDTKDEDILTVEPAVILEADVEEEDESENCSFTLLFSQNQEKIDQIILNSDRHKQRHSKFIEPMPMPKRRRSCAEKETVSTRPPKSARLSERTHSEESEKAGPSSRVRLHASKAHDSSRVHISECLKNLSEKKYVQSKNTKKSPLTSDQKKKLQSIAMKTASAREQMDKRSGPKPKVKESRSRSDFLTTEQPPALINVRRKSTDAFKLVQNNLVENEKSAEYLRSMPSTSAAGTSASKINGTFASKSEAMTTNTTSRACTNNNTSPREPSKYETVLKPKNCPIHRISRVVNRANESVEAEHSLNNGVDHISKAEMETIQNTDKIAPNDQGNVNTSAKAKPMTFEEIISNANKIPRSKRKSKVSQPKNGKHVPSTMDDGNVIKSPSIKSILKKAGSSNKLKRRIKFADQLEHVKEFENDSNEDAELLVSAPAKQLNNYHREPLHVVISSITSWNVDWLLNQENSPPVYGNGYVVSPMLTQYVAFETYQSTIIPLMYHELWATTEAEFSQSKPVSFSVSISEAVEKIRGYSKRRVFNCQAARVPGRPRVNIADFVIVRCGDIRFFAYVTQTKWNREGNGYVDTFEMETASPLGAIIDENTKAVTLTPVSNMRVEMRLFMAIFNLSSFPMREMILNPLKHMRITQFRDLHTFDYKGYDPLNDEQTTILQRVHCECDNAADSNQSHVTLIEGPPGTGKSRLIVALILQLIFGRDKKKRPLKILMCAASNLAVDLITAKLVKIREKMTAPEKKARLNIIRMGIKEKIMPKVQHVSLQSILDRSKLINNDEDTAEVKELKNEHSRMESRIKSLEASNIAHLERDQIEKLKRDLKYLADTISKKSTYNTKSSHDSAKKLVTDASVVCSTLSSSINIMQYIQNFDVCIVDEASQCTEPWTLVPLQYKLSSLVLVGDSQQLPAVVLSSIGKQSGLDRSLFTRIQDAFVGVNIKPNLYSLSTQYRMDPAISHFSNQYFYKNTLKTDPTAISVNFPLKPYNVFSLNFDQNNRNTHNFHNVNEAEFVVKILSVVIKKAHPKKYSYGIITPYSGQRDTLHSQIKKSSMAHYNIPVNTIDSYQGQEKDIIIISNTRTIGTGFLADPKRLNVAITRARKCLIICGNFSSLKNIRVWKALLDDANKRKYLHVIEEKLNSEEILNCMRNT